jgi:hypothetical protein
MMRGAQPPALIGRVRQGVVLHKFSAVEETTMPATYHD